MVSREAPMTDPEDEDRLGGATIRRGKLWGLIQKRGGWEVSLLFSFQRARLPASSFFTGSAWNRAS